MRIVQCDQGSFEWFAARNGRITASRIRDVMAKPKRGDGELAARRNYRTELLCERLTGNPSSHYVTPAMERGSEEEPHSRTKYELSTGNIVDQVGFGFHPRHDFTGASPDGTIGTDGGVELKNPNTETHLNWLVGRIVPEEHADQLYWNMAVFERDWWDFVSRDSRLPENLGLFVKRLYRDDRRIAEIEQEVIKFDAEVDYLIAELGSESVMPPIESFLADNDFATERIGNLDVPEDIVAMMGERGFTP